MVQHNFGYEDIGGTGWGYKSSTIRGTLFTCPENGTADSITVCLSSASDVSVKVKCGLYLHSDLSFKGATEEKTLDLTTTKTWFTFNYADPKPSVLEATDYIIAAFHASSLVFIRVWYINSVADQTHYQNVAYNGFPDPLVVTHSAIQCSIYCTYTVAGGGGISVPVAMHHYSQMTRIHRG